MSFLDKIWQQLEERKKNEGPKKVAEFQEVYQGYRTIHIQDLQRRDANKQSSSFKSGEQLWNRGKKTEIYTYMENSKITNSANNGFFESFYKAYMEHGDLMIKPDQIWMMIMLWFTKYVDDNSNQLRKAFVTHEGMKELTVLTDKNLKDWVPFMNKMIEEIKKNTVENVVESLECNFTTTGLFERIFSTALVMNTCKKYFKYTRLGAGCGIVNVHMAGTFEDWEKLETKLSNLQKFDVNGKLKTYVRGLKPVLNQFTETYKGNVYLQFWNNLYFERKIPNQMAYEPSLFINGWLIKFFTTNEEISEVKELQSFIVDIKYVDLDTKEVTYFNLKGGCRGYSCIDKYVYTPHYSFVIVQDEKKMEKLKLQKRKNERKGITNIVAANNKKPINSFKQEIKPEIKQKVVPMKSFNPPMKKEEPIRHIKIAPKQETKPIIKKETVKSIVPKMMPTNPVKKNVVKIETQQKQEKDKIQKK